MLKHLTGKNNVNELHFYCPPQLSIAIIPTRLLLVPKKRFQLDWSASNSQLLIRLLSLLISTLTDCCPQLLFLGVFHNKKSQRNNANSHTQTSVDNLFLLEEPLFGPSSPILSL